MAESFRMDSAAEGVAAELAAIADDVAREQARLRAALTAEGHPWGNDDPGQEFAKTYVPDNLSTLDAGDKLAESLRGFAANLAAANEELNYQDAFTATQIAHGETPRAARPPATSPQSPAWQLPTPSTATPQIQGATPVSEPAASSGIQQPQPTAAPGATHNPANQPVSRDPRPAPTAAAPTRPGSPAAAGTPSIQARTALPGAPSKAGPIPVASAVGQTAAGRTNSPQGQAAASSGRALAPAGGGPGLSPAESPYGGSRPSATAQPPGGPKEKSGDSKTQTSPKKTVARALSDRHGIQVDEFPADVDDAVVSEVACALDEVLGAHPWITLRRVTIADLGDECAQTWWDREHDAPFVERIELGERALRHPDELADTVAAAVASGQLTPGSEQRPVYSTVIRELGRAIDVTGGFGARRVARRVLVAAYLGHDPDTTPTLARLVGDFKHWRAQFSGCCFPGGRFHAGIALAESFVDVHLHGPAAAEPTQVLHSLLIGTGRQFRGLT